MQTTSNGPEESEGPAVTIYVYVMEDNPEQIGDGLYLMTACFPEFRSHISYIVNVHENNKRLRLVGEPQECDGSCTRRAGQMKDFGKERSHAAYAVAQIIEKVQGFSEKK